MPVTGKVFTPSSDVYAAQAESWKNVRILVCASELNSVAIQSVLDG